MNDKYKIDFAKKQIRSTSGGCYVVYRIIACKDIIHKGKIIAHKNDMGGYVQDASNLSQEGSCWISGDAVVSNGATVRDSAQISDQAMVTGSSSDISGEAIIRQHAAVFNSVVKDKALLDSSAQAQDGSEISGNAQLWGNCVVIGSRVYDNAIIDSYAFVTENSKIYNNAVVDVNAKIKASFISQNAHISGDALIDNSIITGAVSVGSRAFVKSSTISGNIVIKGETSVEISQINITDVTSKKITNFFSSDNKFYHTTLNDIIVKDFFICPLSDNSRKYAYDWKKYDFSLMRLPSGRLRVNWTDELKAILKIDKTKFVNYSGLLQEVINRLPIKRKYFNSQNDQMVADYINSFLVPNKINETISFYANNLKEFLDKNSSSKVQSILKEKSSEILKELKLCIFATFLRIYISVAAADPVLPRFFDHFAIPNFMEYCDMDFVTGKIKKIAREVIYNDFILENLYKNYDISIDKKLFFSSKNCLSLTPGLDIKLS